MSWFKKFISLFSKETQEGELAPLLSPTITHLTDNTQKDQQRAISCLYPGQELSIANWNDQIAVISGDSSLGLVPKPLEQSVQAGLQQGVHYRCRVHSISHFEGRALQIQVLIEQLADSIRKETLYFDLQLNAQLVSRAREIKALPKPLEETEKLLAICPESPYLILLKGSFTPTLKEKLLLFERAVNLDPRYYPAYRSLFLAKLSLAFRLSDVLGDERVKLEELYKSRMSATPPGYVSVEEELFRRDWAEFFSEASSWLQLGWSRLRTPEYPRNVLALYQKELEALERLDKEGRLLLIQDSYERILRGELPILTRDTP